MEDILLKIIANKKLEVAVHKAVVAFAELEKQVEAVSRKASFKDALIQSSTGIIAEFKRRSPSRDWIFKDAKVEEVIPLYSQSGASAISVLTDHDFFGGTLSDLQQAASLTTTPLLRKEFIVDEYQIFQAKTYGASAILLIAAALTKEENKRFAACAKSLGLDVLLEIHNEEEAEYIHENVDVVGVNNRNLRTFVTDVDTSYRLTELIPDGYLKISESGISKAETVRELRQAGFRGFLMGENFMKTPNPGKALEEFVEELLAGC
jgi:indole-3-glycerol phosphate synthase